MEINNGSPPTRSAIIILASRFQFICYSDIKVSRFVITINHFVKQLLNANEMQFDFKSLITFICEDVEIGECCFFLTIRNR